MCMSSIYVSPRAIKTIQEVLSEMDAEFLRLRAAMESHQAKVRMILYHEKDNDDTNAKFDQKGYP